MTAIANLIASKITSLIREGEFRPGERLGTERALAERLNIPRSALRSGLERLESDGGIKRIMGRTGGVFVADGRIERPINTIEGLPVLLRQQGISHETKVLDSVIGLASASESRNLGLESDAYVHRLVRRRDANGIPWSLDSAIIPAALTPGFGQHDLSTSLYGLLSRHYGLVASEAHETIDHVAATRHESETLEVAVGAPLLSVWRVTTTSDGTAMEFAHDLFRADRTRIQARRYGASWKRSQPGGDELSSANA